MGTPIRTTEEIGEGYAERLGRIFGERAPVKLSELDGQIAQTLALEVLSACRPQLRYLTGFVAFGEYFAERRMKDNGNSRRISDDKSRMYNLPEDFDGNSRCIPLMTVVKKTWGEKPKARRQRGFIYRQELLLSQDGDIFVWDWFARCEYRRNDYLYPGKLEIATRSKVRRLVGKPLKRWLRRRENAIRILSALADLVEVTIEKRRKQLASMANLAAFLQNIERHLEVDIRR